MPPRGYGFVSARVFSFRPSALSGQSRHACFTSSRAGLVSSSPFHLFACSRARRVPPLIEVGARSKHGAFSSITLRRGEGLDATKSQIRRGGAGAVRIRPKWEVGGRKSERRNPRPTTGATRRGDAHGRRFLPSVTLVTRDGPQAQKDAISRQVRMQSPRVSAVTLRQRRAGVVYSWRQMVYDRPFAAAVSNRLLRRPD